jgi:hypothetical protein
MMEKIPTQTGARDQLLSDLKPSSRTPKPGCATAAS